MIVAVVAIVLALILYTVSIWSERAIGDLRLWMVLTFLIGFLCDLIGTFIMSMKTTISFNVHSLFGFLAVIIMAFHLLLAVMALKKIWKAEVLFKKFSVYAWSIWVLAFITGMPK